MYDVPHLRFPEFSGEWEKYRLCDVASIVGRIGFRGYTTNDIVTKGKGAIALSPTNIENNKLTYDKDNTYISFYKYEESPEIMIKQGDVIFVKTGSTVGKVAYVDKLICKTTLNPQVVVLKDIQCDNYLLSVLMSTNKFQNAIRKIIVGGAVPTLSQAAMGDIVVTMPQATEQEKLSKFISLLDDRIATQNKIIEKYESLIQAMCDTLIGKKTQQVMLSFNDFGESYSGLSGKSADDFGEGSPYITYMNVYQNQIIDITDIGLVKINKTEQQSLVQYGDILFTLSSETPEEVGIGAVYLGETYPLYLNSFCFGIHITDESKIFPPFLAYYVSSESFRKAVFPLAQGSTRFNLQKGDFMKKVFPFPAIEQQRKIYSILKTYSDKLNIEKQMIKLLCCQKQYLLRQLFI